MRCLTRADGGGLNDMPSRVLPRSEQIEDLGEGGMKKGMYNCKVHMALKVLQQGIFRMPFAMHIK